ncbi:MAG TPA: oligosaccharide flippase family protein [Candidatus Limnocylindrales bacterium]|nr:oligosaccharide flippase family protein [Candidatus Limnocylindrales bacterium]
MSKLKAAVFWSYLFSTGSMAITGLLTFVLAAILDPESFGVLALGMLWVGFAQMLLQHGPTLAVVQLEEITDEQIDAAFWTTVGGALLFGLIFGALAPAWAAFNDLPGLTLVSWALIGVTLLNSVSVIPDAVLRREMKFKPIAVRGVVGNAIGGVVGVVGALLGWGVWALVVYQLVAYGVYTLTVWTVVSWRPRLPRIGRIRREMRVMRKQSIHTLGGAVGVFLANRMDVLMMGAFFGPVMVGLYRFALRLAEMVVDLTSRGLQQVSLPELARHQGDRQELGRRLASLVHIAVVMSVPALAVLAAVAEPLLALVGPQWTDAAAPVRLLCAVSALGTVNALLGPAMQAVQRASVPAVLTWVAAGLSGVGLGTAAWLSRDSGTVGQLTAVGTAALIVQALMFLANVVLAYRFVLRISFGPTLRVITPSLIAAAAAVAAAWAGVRLAGPTPIAGLLAGGAAGGFTALVVLVAVDGIFRSHARRLTARLRPARTTA